MYFHPREKHENRIARYDLTMIRLINSSARTQAYACMVRTHIFECSLSPQVDPRLDARQARNGASQIQPTCCESQNINYREKPQARPQTGSR
jgi:hypothetical protein